MINQSLDYIKSTQLIKNSLTYVYGDSHIIPIKYIYLKCVLIGSSGVGKSSILERYFSNKFAQYFITTVGVDYRIKDLTINNSYIKLQVWDTASQERFRCITRGYYAKSNIIIICFDITDQKSFTDINYWLEDIQSNINNYTKIIICGTKKDLEAKRKIKYSEIKQFCEFHNYNYYEISSKNNEGINEMFQDILLNYSSDFNLEDFTKENLTQESNETIKICSSHNDFNREVNTYSPSDNSKKSWCFLW
jgi:small GTP-binding protein